MGSHECNSLSPDHTNRSGGSAGVEKSSSGRHNQQGLGPLLKLFQHEFAIKPHRLKGLYKIKVARGTPGNEVVIEMLCTVHEGNIDDDDTWESVGPGTAYAPITIATEGSRVTLRPWDPTACKIADSIYNHFCCLPIWSGSWILVVDCSWQTLSHIADIVGPTGRVIGVMSTRHPQQLVPAQRRHFFKCYPAVYVTTLDVKTAHLEDYERTLSLPQSSKIMFLMALHPRCGADSMVGRLREAKEPRYIFCRIFDFLEFGDIANVKSLLFCDWPSDTEMETMSNVVSRHIDIFQSWRVLPHRQKPKSDASFLAQANPAWASGQRLCTIAEEIETLDNSPQAVEGTMQTMDALLNASNAEESVVQAGAGLTDAAPSSDEETRARSSTEAALRWIMLALPLDHITSGAATAGLELADVVNASSRLTTGTRLRPKELMLSTPYFSNSALLLLQNSACRSRERRRCRRSSASSLP